MKDTLEALCKKKGVRLTEQRKVIAQVMASSSDHPDVDELHKRINKIDSKISIATVYRTVKLLKKLALSLNMILKEEKLDMKKPQRNTMTI